jgi:hypothetical protein
MLKEGSITVTIARSLCLLAIRGSRRQIMVCTRAHHCHHQERMILPYTTTKEVSNLIIILQRRMMHTVTAKTARHKAGHTRRRITDRTRAATGLRIILIIILTLIMRIIIIKATITSKLHICITITITTTTTTTTTTQAMERRQTQQTKRAALALMKGRMPMIRTQQMHTSTQRSGN